MTSGTHSNASSNCVSLTISNGIARVQLNRADKHNALDMAMFLAIEGVIKTIKSTPSVRVVIVSGQGPSFCSGIDIKSLLSSAKSAIRLLWKWLPGNANLAQLVSVGWRRLQVPVIMVLHGKCWGGGMQIALGGDYRIASPDCSLAIMEARWGLIPDMGGTLALRECLSADQAMKLAMTATPIEAEQGKQLGLVTEVADDPMQAAEALADQLCQRSPDTNRTVKRLYHQLWCPQERRILALETINQIRMISGKNQRIAVRREQGKTDAQYHL
ncbi:crotonase/enoyl-CoA hydratase family protein [Neiella marina]|uniref:Crotonase/enoyl-CoA hydratase family protein n=1 Tax=Neiella holothuriorum TaxID=2870530 RepID=A0ABS7EGI8_9GAMM|nr:crotonase/enoyl-CoA hydratase family protein [Neiella holothuriorum]MBW8191464.1 crotonase/enoyl-CoA hydratase family protein [Neiella holothuriorum]